MKKIISKIMLCLLIIPCIFALVSCKAEPMSEKEKVEAFNSLKTMITSEIENFKNPTRTSALEYKATGFIKFESLDFSKSGLTKDQQQGFLDDKEKLEDSASPSIYYYGVRVVDDQKIGYKAVKTEKDGVETVEPEVISDGQFESKYNSFYGIKFIETILTCDDYESFKKEYIKDQNIDIEDYNSVVNTLSFTKNSGVYTFKVDINLKAKDADASFSLIVKFAKDKLISYENLIKGSGKIESKVNENEGYESFSDDKVIKSKMKISISNKVEFGKEFNNAFVDNN